MASDIVQEEYYDLEDIKSRLREALDSDVWENIKETALGENLIAVCANTIHLDAMAFYIGLDQFFKSTVTQGGYLEEIAKSAGVISETYYSASITVTLYSVGSAKPYAPLDFSFDFGGTKFYNIQDITIGTISEPTTVVLYEGSVVRKASVPGTSAGSLWSYSQLSSPVPVRVGDKIVRQYLLLPKNTFVDSIIVETSSSYAVPFDRWEKVNSWYASAADSRQWKLGKDYIGRYRVEFGDGVYGVQYPTDSILGVRYVLSSGDGVEIDNTSYVINYQDVNDVTASFVVNSVGELVDGQSEVDQSDLQLQIEAAQNTRNSIIDESDHQAYLDGRADVLASALLFERNQSPPNIEYFNTVSYAIKPNDEGGSFNDADVQTELASDGIKTVAYLKTDPVYRKFNVEVLFSTLAGYDFSVVQSKIDTLLQEEFSWSNLGFGERVNESRVYGLLQDVEGLDVDSLDITVEAVYVENTLTGNTTFDFSSGVLVSLNFVPRRFRVQSDFDELVSGVVARDNGAGELWGDISNREQFDTTGVGASRTTEVVNNMMFTGNNSVAASFRVIDLRKAAGGVTTLNTEHDVKAVTWVDRYNELTTVELSGSTWYMRTYLLPDEFFDTDSLSYLQLQGEYSPSAEKELTLALPSGATGVYGIAYHDSYVYVVYERISGNHRLYRYRITADQIDPLDAEYNGAGYLDLSEKEYRNCVVMDSAFGTDETALWLCSDGVSTPDDESGIDVVRELDDADSVYFEDDFFSASNPFSIPVSWYGLDSDGTNLYGVRYTGAATEVVKFTSIADDGTATVSVISDDSFISMINIGYNNFSGDMRVFMLDSDTSQLVYLDLNDTETEPTVRAGEENVSASVDSLLKVANIDYALKRLSFLETGTNAELWFESEEVLLYSGVEMAVADNLDIGSN